MRENSEIIRENSAKVSRKICENQKNNFEKIKLKNCENESSRIFLFS